MHKPGFGAGRMIQICCVCVCTPRFETIPLLPSASLLHHYVLAAQQRSMTHPSVADAIGKQ
jgi:hypothetical protein